jgi:ribonuclease HII
MLIAGTDEAGRGPVLGSLVIGCVVMEEKDIPKLSEIGVNDSKQLTPRRREQLAIQIKQLATEYQILEIPPMEINQSHERGITLNQLEENNFAKILNNLKIRPDEIYLDALDVNEDRFGQKIGQLLAYQPSRIISKHKGDALFKVVGAASILAKTRRDAIIEEIKHQYGEIGSGYPSDPTTVNYLREYYKKNKQFPPFVRTWWHTVNRIIEEFENQKKIKSQRVLPLYRPKTTK